MGTVRQIFAWPHFDQFVKVKNRFTQEEQAVQFLHT